MSSAALGFICVQKSPFASYRFSSDIPGLARLSSAPAGSPFPCLFVEQFSVNNCYPPRTTRLTVRRVHSGIGSPWVASCETKIILSDFRIYLFPNIFAASRENGFIMKPPLRTLRVSHQRQRWRSGGRCEKMSFSSLRRLSAKICGKKLIFSCLLPEAAAKAARAA